jgi:hypothetical protein
MNARPDHSRLLYNGGVSMKEYLGPLVKGDEIKKVLSNRRNPWVYKTLSASKPEILEEKVKLEENLGEIKDPSAWKKVSP